MHMSTHPVHNATVYGSFLEGVSTQAIQGEKDDLLTLRRMGEQVHRKLIYPFDASENLSEHENPSHARKYGLEHGITLRK